MRFSERVKPVSYFKANAARMLRDVAERGEPYVITQNGEAKAVLQDVASYEAMQQTLALLKLMAMGEREVADGRTVAARPALATLRERFAAE
jgi:prevent-host-death family protein